MSSEDRTAEVLGITISTLVFSGAVIALRFYSRIALLRGALGLDDWFIALAWIITLCYNSFMFAAVSHGYGQRKMYLSTDQYVDVVKYEVIAQFFAVIAYIPSKASVAICLGRIFPSRRLRWLLWLIPILNGLGFIAASLIQLLQCNPVAKQWNPPISGGCIDPQIVVDYVLTAGSIGTAADFALAIIPIYFIARLNMPLREKLAVGVALSLGIGAGVFAIIKTYYITTLGARTDYAYDTVPLVLWSIAEQCAINVAASIPMLRPLLQKVFPRRSGSSDATNKTIGVDISYGVHSHAARKGSTLQGSNGFIELRNPSQSGVLIEGRKGDASYPEDAFGPE